MKRLTSRADSPSAATRHLLSGRETLRFFIFAASSGLTSCVLVDTEDPFYRTLWVAEADPVNEIIVSFPEWQQEQISVSDDMVYGSEGSDTYVISDGSSESQSDVITDTIAGDEAVSKAKSEMGASTAFWSQSSSDDDTPRQTGSTTGKITIEFLCGNNVRVTAAGASGTSGTYDAHGLTAYFSALRLTYLIGETPVTVVFEEAHRTNDLLLVSWHYEGSGISYTSRLVRRSSYEQTL